MERIDVGDAEGVADEAAGSGTAARADGDLLGAGVMDEIPNDQEVAFIVHLLDHFNFGGEAALVCGERVAEEILLGEALEIRDALGEAFAGYFFEVAAGGVARGNFEFGKRVGDVLDLDVAASGDIDGARERVGDFAENLGHLLGGLEVELVGGEFHAVGVAHGLAGLNAEQDFLSVSVFMVEIVAIIGGNDGDAGFLGEAEEFPVDALFDFEALVLDFEEEIAFAEDVA